MSKRTFFKMSAFIVCLTVLSLSIQGVFASKMDIEKSKIGQIFTRVIHYFASPLSAILAFEKQKAEKPDSSIQFTSTDISLAKELDSKDELRSFRDKFVITDPNTIYLNGNSLGRLPKSTIAFMHNVIENEWGDRIHLGRSEHWGPRRERINAKLAQLIGAKPDEVTISDSTSVNFYKLVVAALQFKKERKKIITSASNFPTDVYILEGIIKLLGNQHELVLIPSDDDISIKDAAIQSEIDEETALVTFSHVDYKSAFMYDMAKVTQWAHEKGALMLWDLSHSAGAVPVDLNNSQADLAVGCTYKYLNGGSGCPAFLYVRKDLQDKLENPIWGWLGAIDPFNKPSYDPAPGIKKFIVGSPPEISISALEPALDVHLQAGMDRLRKKSIQQAAYLIYLAEQWLMPLGFELGSPRDPATRGSHVALKHSEARRISQAMVQSPLPAIKVIPDFRPPDNIRLSVVPLYTSYSDIYIAMKRIQEIVKEKLYEQLSK